MDRLCAADNKSDTRGFPEQTILSFSRFRSDTTMTGAAFIFRKADQSGIHSFTTNAPGDVGQM